MHNIYSNIKAIKEAFFGNKRIIKIYVGDKYVWPALPNYAFVLEDGENAVITENSEYFMRFDSGSAA